MSCRAEPSARRRRLKKNDSLNSYLFVRICENLLTHFRGLTEPLLWIQLVAEGSASQRRTFGEAMAKARRVNVEGSVFQ